MVKTRNWFSPKYEKRAQYGILSSADATQDKLVVYRIRPIVVCTTAKWSFRIYPQNSKVPSKYEYDPPVTKDRQLARRPLKNK